jgi:hypothetical protein
MLLCKPLLCHSGFLAANRNNGNFWKQICLNSGPSNVPNDYQSLTMGLRLRDSKEPPGPQEQTYTPTTRPEDCFAVVDVYKHHQEENSKRCKHKIKALVYPVNDASFEKSHGDDMLEPILHGWSESIFGRHERLG